MAFVDGTVDKAEIASVLGYSNALGISERYLDEIKQAAEDRLQEALADLEASIPEGKPCGVSPASPGSRARS